MTVMTELQMHIMTQIALELFGVSSEGSSDRNTSEIDHLENKDDDGIDMKVFFVEHEHVDSWQSHLIKAQISLVSAGELTQRTSERWI